MIFFCGWLIYCQINFHFESFYETQKLIAKKGKQQNNLLLNRPFALLFKNHKKQM